MDVVKQGANATQVGGDHYKQKDGGEEHWDRVARLGLDYWQAAATKYIERWKLKNGIQDLEKARHYLDKYIELARAGKLHDVPPIVDTTQQGSYAAERGR